MIEYENLNKLNSPFFNAYKIAFDEFLKSGWYILGEKVKNFEEAYAYYCSSAYCVGVANGLDALTLALKAFDFEKNNEIIVPSNTYIATILSILNNNLVPVLVEPNIHTYNIDPDKIEEKINKKTKAIMVVHLYGKVCEMDKIMAIAQKYNLKIIEDCAQAHGAKFKNTMAGKFGHFGAHSFYPTKNLGAMADAGAITTDDQSLANKIRILRNYGSEIKYYNDLIGCNSRLDEIQAAFLSIKLKHLDTINQHKRKLAVLYSENLKNDFIKPVVHKDYYDVYHIYNIRHPRRDKLKDFLLNNGIKTEVHYPVPPHKQKALDNIFTSQFPISEEIHQTTLSLPISYMHTEENIGQVIEVMNKF
jgi:dTDP-4-amino-4,6-dideoxygalactose transaminase